MRTAIIALCALAAAGCPAKKQPPPPPPAPAGDAGAPTPDEPAPTREATVDMHAGQTVDLDGGVLVHALSRSASEGASATVRVEPDELDDLPHTGAAARTGPVLGIELPPDVRLPLLIEVPLDPDALPGGIAIEGVHAARALGDAWLEVDAYLAGSDEEGWRLALAASEGGRYGILADASHATPHAGSHALALLVAAPAVLGPPAELPPVAAMEPDGDPEPLYVLDAPVGTVELGGETYTLLPTRDGSEEGGRLAVRDGDGRFVGDPTLIARVLAAHRVRSRLAASDTGEIAGMLDENADRLAIATARLEGDAGLGPAVEAAADHGLGVPSVEADVPDLLSGFEEALADEVTREGVERFLLVLELHRARHAMRNLSRLVAAPPSADTADGERLIALGLDLTWVCARSDAIAELGVLDTGDAVTLPAWHGCGELAAALGAAPSGKRKTKKKTTTKEDVEPLGAPAVLPGIAALSEALAALDGDAGPLVGLVWASPRLLDDVRRLVSGAGRMDPLGLDALLDEAALVAGRTVVPAPPPDTQIVKHRFRKGRLIVTAQGTDEDGRTVGYRWWIDEDGEPHLLKSKGKGTIVTDLSELRSGSHDLYVAALDDDDQPDPTAARFSFYMRRHVEVDTRDLDVDFDAEPWNLNAEHTRAIKLFVRSLEGPVAECADDHYRWGIDSGGRVAVSFRFSADKTANVAHDGRIVEDTFKNDDMADCILKALKKPRMRYDQDFRPAAGVSVTMRLKPSIVFFDVESLGGSPGRDVVGAALYLKCTAKALRRVARWCEQAVSHLPGPGYEKQQLIDAGLVEPEPAPDEEGTEEGGGDEAPDGAADGQEPAGGAPRDAEAAPGQDGQDGQDEQDGAVEEDAQEQEDDGEEPLVIPPPEFDPREVRAECVEDNVSIVLENCMALLPKKKLWCVDSCLKKADKCTKACRHSDEQTDDEACKENCWLDEAFPCAEHCAVRKTPFEEGTSAAQW